MNQEQVVQSLINKDLDWEYGDIIQTGVNTFFYQAEDRLVTCMLSEPVPDFYSRKIVFINGELEIEQKTIVFKENLSEQNAKILREHIENKINSKKHTEDSRFTDWIKLSL